jgi:hypothetical protein
VCVSVCRPAPLLGCRLIRVRVESLYICTSYPINTAVHCPTWYQRARVSSSSPTAATSSLLRSSCRPGRLIQTSRGDPSPQQPPPAPLSISSRRLLPPLRPPMLPSPHDAPRLRPGGARASLLGGRPHLRHRAPTPARASAPRPLAAAVGASACSSARPTPPQSPPPASGGRDLGFPRLPRSQHRHGRLPLPWRCQGADPPCRRHADERARPVPPACRPPLAATPRHCRRECLQLGASGLAPASVAGLWWARPWLPPPSPFAAWARSSAPSPAPPRAQTCPSAAARMHAPVLCPQRAALPWRSLLATVGHAWRPLLGVRAPSAAPFTVSAPPRAGLLLARAVQPPQCCHRRHPRPCSPSSSRWPPLNCPRRHPAAQIHRASFIAVVNTPCQVRRRPLPDWTRRATHPFIAFVGSIAAAAFPAESTLLRPSRLDPPTLWLDRVFPSGSVAVVAFPVGSDIPHLFYRGRGHHDRLRRVHCRRPPWRGSLMLERSKKQEGRPAGVLLLCRPADR